jgi:LysR family transcriptional regulator, nod-box dependent transcriptional activator
MGSPLSWNSGGEGNRSMRFNKLDLNLLVALDHLLNLRSVSDAAERMHITQSAMSNALTRLRDYFEDELLVKIGRGMELTPRAAALKDAVRDVLVRVEWTIATTADFDPGQSDRRFSILVSDYTLATLVPRVLGLCQRIAPSIRFNFLHQVESPERLLERGDVDLLLIPTEFRSRRHPYEIAFEEDFCGVVWKDGRLAVGKLTRLAFVEASHVAVQPPGGAQPLESILFRQYDLVRRTDVITYSFMSLPSLVIGTDRIATVHRRLAQQAERTLPVKILELPYRLPKMRQAAQWHKYRAQDAGLIWLRRVIREAAASAGPEADVKAEVNSRGNAGR